MKKISGKIYRERKDLQAKVFGLDKYNPGKKTVGGLFVRMTSGTTNGSPVVFITRFVLNKILLNFYDYSKPLLVISGKNGTGLLWAQTVLSQYKKPARVLFLNKSDLEHPLVSSILADFKPETIHSMVHILNFFMDKVRGKKVVNFNKKIKKIHVSGETQTKTFLGNMSEIFPKSGVELHYGMSELGTVAINCGYHGVKKRANGTFHIYHPVKPVSIIKPNQDGVGEIAVSSPTLSNYLTGDAGKIVTEKCACGADKTLMLYGRINYDIVNCAGAVFHILEVDRVFSLLNRYVADYCLETREVFGSGKTVGSFTVKLVPEEKLRRMKGGEDFISDFLKKHLQLTKTRRLSDLIDSGIFLPPKIVFTPSLHEPGKKIRMKKGYG